MLLISNIQTNRDLSTKSLVRKSILGSGKPSVFPRVLSSGKTYWNPPKTYFAMGKRTFSQNPNCSRIVFRSRSISTFAGNTFERFDTFRDPGKFQEVKLITLRLASPDTIRRWAETRLPNGKVVGLVHNANTLHHNTLKPLKGGLFCERIFGPTKDFQCACGIQKEKNFSRTTSTRLFCLKCDVEYTWALKRRYQSGYIRLVSPVAHLWYVKETPSFIAVMLDMKRKTLDSIIYCSSTLTIESCINQVKTNFMYSQPLSNWREIESLLKNNQVKPLQNSFDQKNLPAKITSLNNDINSNKIENTTENTFFEDALTFLKTRKEFVIKNKLEKNANVKILSSKSFFSLRNPNKSLNLKKIKVNQKDPRAVYSKKWLNFLASLTFLNENKDSYLNSSKNWVNFWQIAYKLAKRQMDSHLMGSNVAKNMVVNSNTSEFPTIFGMENLSFSLQTFSQKEFLLVFYAQKTNRLFKKFPKFSYGLKTSLLKSYEEEKRKIDLNQKKEQNMSESDIFLLNYKKLNTAPLSGIHFAITAFPVFLHIIMYLFQHCMTESLVVRFSQKTSEYASSRVLKQTTVFYILILKLKSIIKYWSIFKNFIFFKSILIKNKYSLQTKLRNVRELRVSALNAVKQVFRNFSILSKKSLNFNYSRNLQTVHKKFSLFEKWSFWAMETAKNGRWENLQTGFREVFPESRIQNQFWGFSLNSFQTKFVILEKNLLLLKYFTKITKAIGNPESWLLRKRNFANETTKTDKEKKRSFFGKFHVSTWNSQIFSGSGLMIPEQQIQYSKRKISGFSLQYSSLFLKQYQFKKSFIQRDLCFSRCLKIFQQLKFSKPHWENPFVEDSNGLSARLKNLTILNTNYFFGEIKSFDSKKNKQFFALDFVTFETNVNISDKNILLDTVADNLNSLLSKLNHSLVQILLENKLSSVMSLSDARNNLRIFNKICYSTFSVQTLFSNFFTNWDWKKRNYKKRTVLSEFVLPCMETMNGLEQQFSFPLQLALFEKFVKFERVLTQLRMFNSLLAKNKFNFLNRVKTFYNKNYIYLNTSLKSSTLWHHNYSYFDKLIYLQFIKNAYFEVYSGLNFGTFSFFSNKRNNYSLLKRYVLVKKQLPYKSNKLYLLQKIYPKFKLSGMTPFRGFPISIRKASWNPKSLSLEAGKTYVFPEINPNWGRKETKLLLEIPRGHVESSKLLAFLTKNREYFCQGRLPFSDHAEPNIKSILSYWIGQSNKKRSVSHLFRGFSYASVVGHKSEKVAVNSLPFSSALYNNIYVLSNRYNWDLDEDLQTFLHYFSEPISPIDVYIPAYKHRLLKSNIFRDPPPVLGGGLIQKLLVEFHPNECSKILMVLEKSLKMVNILLKSCDDFLEARILRLKRNYILRRLKYIRSGSYKFTDDFLRFSFNKNADGKRSEFLENGSFQSPQTKRFGVSGSLLNKKTFSENTSFSSNEVTTSTQKFNISSHSSTSFKLKNLRSFLKESRPEWMILSLLPVLPPDLRPILQIGNQVAASDLNRLYQKVIYRNERLKRFLKDSTSTNSPQMKFAYRLLQEAVDNLIDNGKGKGTPETDNRGLPLKSLTELLKGKKGRFRQNLLGKRVDYSGRSVIVVGPRLRLHECGLPKEMALELFLPFLIQKIFQSGKAATILGAKLLLKTDQTQTWEFLTMVMRENPVLLNRAPTLHRFGFQAFQPRLVEGKAILLHPLVCPAFNADFDGDQMAVHVPITAEAKVEAWKLMLARNHMLSASTGEGMLLPSQDMVLGCYYLTATNPKLYQKSSFFQQYNYIFTSIEEVLQAYESQKLNLHSFIWLRWNGKFQTNVTNEKLLELQINRKGQVKKIFKNYVTYVDYSWKKPHWIQTNGLNHELRDTKVAYGKTEGFPDQRISHLYSGSEVQSIFIKTTPGRVLFYNFIFN